MAIAKSHGMSPSRLARLDRFISEQYVEPSRLPGTLIKVWRRGELVHSGMAGMMDVASGRPMQDDAIFRMYSMTKPIMGVALMALVEEGLLALDDNVSDYIPAWSDLKVLEEGSLVPARRPMTVLDLARHTSGLSGYGGTEVHQMYQARRIAQRDLEGGLEGLVGMLAELPLEFHPGEGLTYSISATVLGYVMQQATGMTLGEILRTRIFAPLGMDETGFHVPLENAGRLATLYMLNGDGPSFSPRTVHDFTQPPRLESGDGGLVSTAADYMRFCRMLLGRGSLDGVQVLSPKSVALLGTNMLPGNRDWVEMAGNNRFDDWKADGWGISLCMGTTMDVARRRMPASVGDMFWAGAGNTYMLVDPAEDLAVVFLTQLLDPPFFFDLQRRLYTMVYAAIAD